MLFDFPLLLSVDGECLGLTGPILYESAKLHVKAFTKTTLHAFIFYSAKSSDMVSKGVQTFMRTFQDNSNSFFRANKFDTFKLNFRFRLLLRWKKTDHRMEVLVEVFAPQKRTKDSNRATGHLSPSTNNIRDLKFLLLSWKTCILVHLNGWKV